LRSSLFNALVQKEQEKTMSTAKKVRGSHEKSATGSDIRAIAGSLDDDIVAAILHTDATRAEIMQALDWLEESHYTLSTYMRPMNERVRRVYEILDYAENWAGRKKPRR
jgi:hypothetical protein